MDLYVHKGKPYRYNVKLAKKLYLDREKNGLSYAKLATKHGSPVTRNSAFRLIKFYTRDHVDNT